MSPVILCLMENTVQLKSPKMLRYKFDLKGSTQGRRTKGVVTSKTDRKDLDYLDLKKEEPEKLSFAEINKHLIMILKRDVFYLKSRGLIDYSLLLAVELSAEKFKPEQLVEKRIHADIATRRQSVMINGGAVSQNRLSHQLSRASMHFLKRGQGSKDGPSQGLSPTMPTFGASSQVNIPVKR